MLVTHVATGRRRRRRWCYNFRPNPPHAGQPGLSSMERSHHPIRRARAICLVMMVVLNPIRSPPRHGTCLWLDYYHHGPPHTHLSSALVFTHAALPSPSAPPSLPAPSVSRLHLPLHPHLNLAHPSLFAPPFPSPSSPRLRLTSLTSAFNLALLTPTAHHRSHICMTSTRPAPGFESQPPPSRWPRQGLRLLKLY